VKIGYPRQGGGPRALAALAGMLAVSALACPTAAAQLPELPAVDPAALPTEPVETLVQEPLPEPVESVVENSPVAPVREEVRKLVGSVPGTDPGSEDPGGGGDQPSSASTGGSAGSGSGSGATQPAGTASPAQGRGGSSVRGPVSGGEASSATPAPRGEPRARRARRDSPAARRRAAETDAGPAALGPRAAETDAGGGRVKETIRRIIAVVPDAVWIALAVLLVLALALGVRTLVERRRVRALARERERLLREVGLLERALLPEVPERLGALSASVAYRPADGPAAGGDFYDVFELPAGGVAVLVGDVSGHGRDALERTNSMRTVLRACLEAGMSPRAALESAGRGPAGDQNGGFTTVVIGSWANGPTRIGGG
jgi:hypothetical protein